MNEKDENIIDGKFSSLRLELYEKKIKSVRNSIFICIALLIINFTCAKISIYSWLNYMVSGGILIGIIEQISIYQIVKLELRFERRNLNYRRKLDILNEIYNKEYDIKILKRQNNNGE